MAAKKKSTARRTRSSGGGAASLKLVHVQLVGGEVKNYAIPPAGTLGALKAQLGLNKHQANINGEVEDNDSAMLRPGSVIVFTEKVKGA
jgi:hypothetical protein